MVAPRGGQLIHIFALYWQSELCFGKISDTIFCTVWKRAFGYLDLQYMNRLYSLKYLIEWKAFGVCDAIGERLGIATSRIRLWFIYVSFLTLFSPVAIYMVLAFWVNLKRYVWQHRRNPLLN